MGSDVAIPTKYFFLPLHAIGNLSDIEKGGARKKSGGDDRKKGGDLVPPMDPMGPREKGGEGEKKALSLSPLSSFPPAVAQEKEGEGVFFSWLS